MDTYYAGGAAPTRDALSRGLGGMTLMCVLIWSEKLPLIQPIISMPSWGGHNRRWRCGTSPLRALLRARGVVSVSIGSDN